MNYPAILPCPQIDGYQVAVVYGTTGVRFENGMSRRRKGPKREQHVFSLSIVLTTAQLWTWQSWANDYGYEWHWINLPSNYAGATAETAVPHYIRYIGDITIEPVDALYFAVSVQAELDINTKPGELFEPTGDWIIGMSPATPPGNVISAETANGIATDQINAGIPGLTAA